jgi:hypothetical protein
VASGESHDEGHRRKYVKLQVWTNRDHDTPVELVRLYSNPSLGSVRLGRLRGDALSQRRLTGEPVARVPLRVSQRLGPELLERIMAEYVSGASTVHLAKHYGLGKALCYGCFDKTNRTFVQPGIDQQYTFETAVSVSTAYVLVWSSFDTPRAQRQFRG